MAEKTIDIITKEYIDAHFGIIKQQTIDASVSMETGVSTPICSIELDAGAWIITGVARFSSNSTGTRGINISSTSGYGTFSVRTNPASGVVTSLQCVAIMKPQSTTTYYLNAIQTSGATLTTGTTTSTLNLGLRAVRVG